MAAPGESLSGRPAFSWTDIDWSVDLIRTLAQALHEAGQPAHRLEQTLHRAARRLGISVHVSAMPTVLFLSFDRSEGPLTYVMRVQPGAINPERLGQLTAVADAVIRGTADPAEAKARIDQIRKAPPRWGWPATVSAYVLSGAAFAVFFRGGLTEVLVATVVGLAVGVLAVTMARVRLSGRLFELSAAAAAGFVANVADWPLGSFVEWVPIAAGLIILLPGISLVDAVEELSYGHLSAGSARLAGMGVVFLALIFGVTLGWAVGDLFPGSPPLAEPKPLPDWAALPALLVVAVGSTIRFRARPADVGMILVSSALALAASRAGMAWIGELAGPFLASLLLGLAGALYARLLGRPAEMFIIPGLALLVPGSIGLRSLSALVSQDPQAGISTGFHMFLVAIDLVAGLLFSNSLLRQRPA
jgi:uncharacterized membrane protein YjjP (DUF1212 family)